MKRIAVLALALFTLWAPMMAESQVEYPTTIKEQPDSVLMQQTWQQFRHIHPYGYQTVALKHVNGKSVVVISEPSRSVTRDALVQLFKRYGGSMTIKRQPLGYGGWLADAVGILQIEQSSFARFTHDLFMLLYGTDYKASYLDLDQPIKHTYFSPYRLNYSISAAELSQWFMVNKEPFLSSGGATKNLSALLSGSMKGTNALYYSKGHEFVAWIIAPDEINKDDASFKINARKFALDADLIIGAFGQKGKRIAILARQRLVPVDVLPPLRIETILLLATTKNDNLAQSFERYNIFAGKTNKGYDIAPILLSDELWNTEYGNLLNLTDQVLKGWSENGTVYDYNYPYPEPVDWAFNEGAYREIVGYAGGSLTYNWNTAGAGYVIQDMNQWDVFAINRTGSLPVSYIPEGMEGKVPERVNEAEELAYDFFAELNNPELVREVQYATIYQIFRYFRSPQTDDLPVYIPLLKQTLQRPDFSQLLKNLNKPDYSFFDSITANLLRLIRDSRTDAFNNSYQAGLTRFEQRVRATSSGFYAQQLVAKDPYGSFRDFLWDQYGAFLANQLLYEDVTKEQIKATYDAYLFPALDSVLTYMQRFEKQYGAFPYEDAAKYFVCHEAENSYSKALQQQSNLYTAIVIAYNEKVADIKKQQQEGKLTIGGAAFEKVQLDEMEKQLQSIDLEIKHIKEVYKALIPSLAVTKALGTINWLLTDPGQYDAPIGDFYAGHFHSQGVWMKSSPVACSKSSIQGMYGGHNLDAAITPIKVAKNAKIAKGKCKIDKTPTGQKIILVNAEDKVRVTPDVLRAIERKNITTDYTLPKAPSVRPKTILADPEAKQALVNGEAIESIAQLREQIATDIAQGGSPKVKEVHFRNFTAREVHMFADELRETIVERVPDGSMNLKNYNINEDIQVISQHDGTVKLVLQQRPETLPVDGNIKAATLEISVPENVKGEVKNALLRVFKKSEGQINNRFKWKRELKRELQVTHPEIDSYDIKDELNHIYGHTLKRNRYENIFVLAA